MRKSFLNFISTSLYAQFPGIEVHNVEDYAQSVHFDKDRVAVWAEELSLLPRERRQNRQLVSD